VTWGRRRRAVRAETRPAAASDASIAPGDRDDLAARFAAIEADLARDRDRRLVYRLRPLVERRTPARAVEAVPALGAARIRFADGTAVLVHGDGPGDLGILARWVRCGSVVPCACALDGQGTHLVLRSPSRRRQLGVRVAGFDQAE
jgi:hypothetical protein